MTGDVQAISFYMEVDVEVISQAPLHRRFKLPNGYIRVRSLISLQSNTVHVDPSPCALGSLGTRFIIFIISPCDAANARELISDTENATG